MKRLQGALIVLAFSITTAAALPEPRTSAVQFVAGGTCCPGCSYPSSCCCSPRNFPVTSVRASFKTIVRRTTTNVKATKWTTATVTTTVVAKTGKQAMSADADADSRILPLIPDEDSSDVPPVNAFAPPVDLAERSEAAEPELEATEEPVSPPDAKELFDRSDRHLCAFCPPKVSVKSLNQLSLLKSSNVRFCCPPRKTVWTTRTRLRTSTRIIRRTTATVRRTSIRRITITAKQILSGRMYYDNNGNGVYDAGVDKPMANMRFILYKNDTTARLAKRGRTPVANFTTNDQGLYTTAILIPIDFGQLVFLVSPDLPSLPTIPIIPDAGGMLPVDLGTVVNIAIKRFPTSTTSHTTTTATGTFTPAYLPVGLIGSSEKEWGTEENVDVDPSGNVFIGLQMSGNVELLDQHFFPLQGNASQDGLVLKIDGSNGRVAWARSFGIVADTDTLTVVKLSQDGKVLFVAGQYGRVTGMSWPTVDIDIGPFHLPGEGEMDTWFAALNATTGEPIWANHISASHHEWPGNFALAPDNNPIFAGGYYWRDGFTEIGVDGVRFPVQNAHNCFLGKFDATTGRHLWFKTAGGAGIDYCYRVKVDSAGSNYLIGSTDNTMVWDACSYATRGNTDGFIVKVDSAGTCQWMRGFGGTQSDTVTGIALDAAGNVIVAGQFQSPTLNVAGRTLTNSNSSGGFSDVALVKMDAAGNVLWAKSWGGKSTDESTFGIQIDAAGNILFPVFSTNSTGFNFGTGDLTEIYGTYLVKVDAATGTPIAHSYIGEVTGVTIRINPVNQHIIMSGMYTGFDGVLTSGTAEATGKGDTDVFVLELNSDLSPIL